MTEYPLWRRPFKRWEFALYFVAVVIGAAAMTWGPSRIGMIWLAGVVLVGVTVADVRAQQSLSTGAVTAE